LLGNGFGLTDLHESWALVRGKFLVWIAAIRIWKETER